MLKQNLLDFSGLIDFSVKSVLVTKTPQILTIYVYQWQKRHQTRTCLAFTRKTVFLIGTALIQRDAAVWMLESALKTYKPEASIFPQCLHKVLFMVASEEFWRVDGECNFICLFPSCKIANQLPLGIPPPKKVTKESFDKILTQEISYHPFRLRPVGNESLNSLLRTTMMQWKPCTTSRYQTQIFCALLDPLRIDLKRGHRCKSRMMDQNSKWPFEISLGCIFE